MQFDMERQLAAMREGGAKPCCLKRENLSVTEDKPTHVILRCAACGCRHFRMAAPAVKVGSKGISIGGVGQ